MDPTEKTERHLPTTQIQEGACLPSEADPTGDFHDPDGVTIAAHDGGSSDASLTDASIPAPPGYEILGELGRGGMGVVYRARQIRLDRLVALKMILAGPHAGGQERDRFRREAQAAASFQHPNIVQIFEVGETDGRPYLALELVEGGTLADKLRGTPQSPRTAARLLENLARAVHSAHQHGVIHRDLKPANVLLASDDRSTTVTQICDPRLEASLGKSPDELSLLNLAPKITDFGLAKRITDSAGPTQSGAIMGTPSYMAPEQAGGKNRQAGPATDIYALGAILYELVTGRPPFKAPTAMDTLLQVLTTEPVSPSRLQPKLPRDLETICLKCLQKDPARRYSSADALAEDLRRFRANEPIQARLAGRIERLAKWTRRRPAMAALLGVVLAAAVIVVAGGLVYQSRLERSNRDLGNALAREKQEHDRAQEHLEKATTVVDQMLTEVTDERLANVPEIVKVRRQLLNEARKYYQWSLKREDQNSLVRQQTARACFRTAGLHLLVGELKEALAFGNEAAELQQKLVADFPDEPNFRLDLSKTYTYLGHAFAMNQEMIEAVKAYEKAVQLAEKLMKDSPGTPEYRESLALNRAFLSYFHGFLDPPLAEENIAKAIELAEDLYKQHPKNADYQCFLASCYGQLAMLRIQTQQFAAAEAPVRKSLAILQPSGIGPPSQSRHFLSALGTTKYAEGVIEYRAKRWQRAEESLKEGIDAMEKLVEHTRAFPWRMQLALSYPMYGQLLEDTNRPGLAEEIHRKALDATAKLAQDFPNLTFLIPTVTDRRILLMVYPTRRGENLAKTIAEADELMRKTDLTPLGCYNLACVYALASGLKSTPLLEAEDFAKRAITLLERADNAGFFRGANATTLLPTDTDLSALRQRDDYRAFEMRVQKKAKQAADAKTP